jgi:hypothetical protein
MKQKDQEIIGRRTLLTGVGVTVAAGLAASATSANAQSAAAPARFQPARHSLDSWLGEMTGEHRVFVDSSTVPGGANALRYASNILTAHAEDYEGSASDYAMVVCFRHASTIYGFDDALWEKYGSSFDRSADPAPTTNPMNQGTGSNGGNSIPGLIERGAQFAICSRATRANARGLARSTGIPYEEVLEDLLGGAIPNSRFVPAGVVAATRSQEYGFSLLYSA